MAEEPGEGQKQLAKGELKLALTAMPEYNAVCHSVQFAFASLSSLLIIQGFRLSSIIKRTPRITFTSWHQSKHRISEPKKEPQLTSYGEPPEIFLLFLFKNKPTTKQCGG